MSIISDYWFSSQSGGPGPGPAPIGHSLRFRGAQRLNRTPTAAGNVNVWTWSCWIKKADWGTARPIFVPTVCLTPIRSHLGPRK